MEAPWVKAEREVEERFGCEHENTVTTYRMDSLNRRHYWRMCVRCGDLHPPHAVTVKELSPRDVECIPEFDETRRERWKARRAALRQELIEKYTEENRDGMEDYYQSAVWKDKTRLVRERSGGLCEGCRKRPAIACHHLSYDHFRDEFLWELVDVCKACHDKAHPQHQPDF